MGKVAAIVQSNYIPWKGYFDLINMVDEFILLDDAQYTKRDWRNRNRIKTPSGPQWLTIPVFSRGKNNQKIKDVQVADPTWNLRHWKTIVQNYSTAQYFHNYYSLFEELFLGCEEQYLSIINHRFLTAICQVLGINTRLSWSEDYSLVEGKNERLIYLCQQVDASDYISGPAALDYIDKDQFGSKGISVEFIDYSGYPEYDQLFPPFTHEVSVIDLIFNEGSNAERFMQSF